MTRLRVLIADDNPVDADLEVRALRRGGIPIEHRVVWTETAFREALENFDPDVILCDFSFPDFDGLTASKIASDLRPATPVIFVSGTISEERAVIALQHGAVDYVLKSSLMRLPNAVIQAVTQAREHQQRLQAEQHIVQLSRTKEMLAGVNTAIVRLRDRFELFEQTCEIATRSGGFDYSFIMTVNPATRRVDLPAIAGVQTLPKEQMELIMQRVADNLEGAPGVVAQSLRTVQPAAVNDVRSHPELPTYDALVRNDINSIASFPLVVGGRAMGVMVFATHQPGVFDTEEMELLRTLTGNLSFAIDLMEKQMRVDYLSYYDPLTELPNRSLFMERLRQSLAIARRAEEMVAIMLLDIYRFAHHNAVLGEHGGDELLRQIARRLRAYAGEEQAARVSGDRFALAFPALRDLQPVTALLSERGLEAFDEPFHIEGREVRVTARAGFTIFPHDGDDAESMFRNAEIALQNARGSGAAFQFYSTELSRRLIERIELETHLERAVQNMEFVLHYQPKFDVLTRNVVGVEALVRWNDADRPQALISPSEFIPVLEQTGMIVVLGRWVMHEAAQQHARWLRSGIYARIAVNLSAKQLRDPNIVDEVESAIEQADHEAGLDLEITESMLMEDFDDAAAKLRHMRALGSEIALDDFGTGYSSLAMLHRLPISTIKIDRTFIDGVTQDADKTSLVTTIISLAQGLRRKVVAEGVETEEQARLLQLLRCDQMQGYLLGRPCSVDEMTKHLLRA